MGSSRKVRKKSRGIWIYKNKEKMGEYLGNFIKTLELKCKRFKYLLGAFYYVILYYIIFWNLGEI
jgi:hypothetical protein